jgi:glycosyltransferase involved in cell wall biosynthesis
LKRISIITSHVIQYNAPLFKELARSDRFELKVFYTSGDKNTGIDAGFKRSIEWDIPMLDGYEFEFLENHASNPGLGRFLGIRNQKILERIKQFRPDFILVYGWNYHSHLQVMRHFRGKIPVWFRGDSTLLDEKPGLKQMARRIFLKWVYRSANKFLCVGKANKDYFIAHGIREDQLIHVPHAVDNDHFYDSPENKYEVKARNWRKELGIPENALVFLSAGKFIPKKDPLLLIKAFKQVYQSTSLPVYLILVGNGPLETQIRKEAAGHSNIFILPFQNQSRMPVIYRLGDVYVLPSKGPGETWGLAINEAMACARPILASNKAGGSEDLVKEGRNGYIFREKDLMDLCEKMKIMVENYSELENLGLESKRIIEDFSYSRIVHTMEQLAGS